MYSMPPLPPGMAYFTNQVGAALMLNRTRATIWNWVNQGRVRGYDSGGQCLIPFADVAAIARITEEQVYNIAIVHRIPIWQYYLE